MRIGAHYIDGGRCEFVVWSPLSDTLKLRIISPAERTLDMHKGEGGYWRVVAEGVAPGTLYDYILPGQIHRPDPASHFQPRGVHGPSEVIAHTAFDWQDAAWRGVSLEEIIFYELHVGTFTPEGTFEAIIDRLDDLKYLGVTAIELMPIAQFPGERNWGYDGAYPFAAQNSYGGPEGLKRLVDACHKNGIAVALDVVYNHLGPEGNYLESFAPYFTAKYHTPWGKAVNFDDAHSDGARNYFIENALYWFRDFHIDALRLDAVHAMLDLSAKHFLAELSEAVEEFSREKGRDLYLIAESNLNDTRIIRPREAGGYGIDAQWSDDFHHSLRALLTGERAGYYEDFGELSHLVKAYGEGFVYDWQYSRYRGRRHGSSSIDVPARRFVVFNQNHDQVGNRMLGERLAQAAGFEAAKLAAGAVLLSPFVPLFFMGEEYDETSPFLYFVSHSDEWLIAAVREGRKAEFEEFRWQGEPPDPQAEETFLRSKLDWGKRNEGAHKNLLDFYRELVRLRKEIPALARLDKNFMDVTSLEAEPLIFLRRWTEASHVLIILNFNKTSASFSGNIPEGRWQKLLDSSDEAWNGPGPSMPYTLDRNQSFIIMPQSVVLYRMET